MTGTWPLGWATGDIETGAQFGKGIGAIFDTTLASAAATIDMTSIVGSYAHLLLVASARGDNATSSIAVDMRLNGDTGANYDYQQLHATATTFVASETFAGGLAFVASMADASAAAGLFNGHVLFIPNYAGSSNNKSYYSIGATKIGTSSGNVQNDVFIGGWRSSAAINRITLFPSGGNFAANTRVTLYGMGA